MRLSSILTVAVLAVASTQASTTPRRGSAHDKVTICHKGKNTLSVDEHAVPAHLAHGDSLGACGGGGGDTL